MRAVNSLKLVGFRLNASHKSLAASKFLNVGMNAARMIVMAFSPRSS